ncbi:helix-turn-helix transcriptional regulator [Xanthobacteraceae bacterium Astr-EGSB]|uniref:helix-turn-helix transcriptional regulator n=1 Tax=Astrobacterium formosum TaxID=3069710 RepID=UPI0027B7B922|nr:helix-turn-helix transcriptional regulator [Xanthobacteraceae bacterium Astr-EGSB]
MEPAPDAPFRLEVTTRLLPDLAIAQSVRSPMRTLHRGGASDDISMQVLLAGRSSIQVDGRTHELTAGMGAIGRHGTGAIIDVPAGAGLLSIRLRRRLIEPLIKNFVSFSVIRDTQAMRLLLGYVRMIEAEETIVSPQARLLVTTHVHDLVALAFGAAHEATGMLEARGKRAGMLAAIKADIGDNLDNPSLSVTMAAAKLGVTPRYVHMLFEAEGVTFSEYVLGQRLARVHRLLGDTRFAHRSISAIALTTGFGDLSYFNRTFRRRYGVTPSDVRAQSRR